MKKKTFITLSYKEVEELAHKHYGAVIHGYQRGTYSFVATGEHTNGDNVEIDVDGDIDDEEDAKSIRNGTIPMWGNNTLLNVLCADGHIEAGDYLVEISW